jgi:hypothetical protein
MKAFWITFADGLKPGCCEGESALDAQARAQEKTGRTVANAEILPYPASPIIWQDPTHPWGPCPPFCYTPNECKGKSACPKMKACDD